MSSITPRLKKVLYRLLESKNEVTSKNLAISAGVSTRTIKKDIIELNTLLEEYGAEIEAHLGKGYQLIQKDEFLFSQLLLTMKNEENQADEIPRYRYERVNYIIKKLLAIDYYISQDFLIDELYVSRSTIAADLKEVKEILKEYHLSVISKPNYGSILEGTEIDKRLCISEYFFHNNVSTGYFAADHAMFVSASNQHEISFINEILINIINQHNLQISDYSLQNLVIHIVIALRRWRFYNYVHLEEKERLEIMKIREYPAGKAIKEQLERWQKMILPEDEACYFALHLQSKHVNRLEDLDNEILDKVELTLFEIYRCLHQKFNFLVSDKSQYEENVRLHIPVMIQRLRHGMVVRNLQTYRYFGKYPLATHITFHFIKIIENNFNISMNINEFSYLVLYTNLLLSNSMRKKSRILLATCQGRPEMITLLNELNESVIGIHSVDVCDYYKIGNKDLRQYDLLISTVPFAEKISIPAMYVPEDYSIESALVQDLLQNKQSDREFILDILKQQYFIANCKAIDRDEVFKKVSSCFENNFEVYQMLWSGERILCGETQNQAVIFHTEQTLDEDFIFVAILKKTIIWKKQWIKAVFWVNCYDNDFKKLTAMYRFVEYCLQNEAKFKDLLDCQNYTDYRKFVYQYVGKGESI